jgi:DNA-binding LacI/PurR family transcriptional regulator/signal transduction histidine kinase
MAKIRDGGPTRIGGLASGLFNSYNHLVWRGASDFCRERGAAFLYFAGGELESPDRTQRSRNFIFDLATGKTVDGLLVNSATTFHHVGPETILSFYLGHADLPIVSIGIKVGDWPAVMTDGASGTRDAVLHLIQTHRSRRIAFIGGPERHVESNARLSGYRRALEESGIGYDPGFVAYGTFLMASGSACLDALLARNGSFDAVMVANDEMAFGVMDRAREIGISVPDELAVCGFDDIPDARTLPVSLSTVRQPIVEESRAACGLLFEMLGTGRASEDIVLPSSFIPRRSCGCLSPEAARAGSFSPAEPARAAPGSSADRGVEPLAARRGEILSGLRPPAGAEKEPILSACGVLIDSLAEHMRLGGAEGAVAGLRRALGESVYSGSDDFCAWENAITLLRRAAGPFIDPDAIPLFEAFWHRARVLVQESSHQSQYLTSTSERAAAARYREINWRVIRSFDMPKLIETIRTRLPETGIKACYLCLLDPEGGRGEADARLLLAYDEAGSVLLPEGGIPFASREIVPAAAAPFRTPGDYFIEALFIDEERLGFIVFRTEPSVVHFEEFRRQVSSALKGALLNAEVRTLAEAEGRKAAELSEAYDALKANQRKLLAAEKMASMGRLTAGIAHEMNTPIATIRAAGVELDRLIGEYGASIGDPEVGAEDHRAIAAEMKEISGLIKKAAERTAAFVQSVKSRTKDLSRAEFSDFDAVRSIEETIRLLDHFFRKENCPVEFTHAKGGVILNGVEGRFSEVISNILVNAIDASKPRGGGTIAVDLSENGGETTVSIRDRGVGIPPDVMPMIFDPMFTTKSLAEGTGLGLTIALGIVAGDFGGTIEARSEAGGGATFTVRLPKKGKDGGHA